MDRWETAFVSAGHSLLMIKVLHGALVGGPDQDDNYIDDRQRFQVENYVF